MAPRSPRPLLIALDGPSGVGKSTVASRLARRPGWVRLDEAYDRLRPRPRIDVYRQKDLLRVERRLLAEEARRYRAGRRLARGGRTVVADTGFLGPVGYTLGLWLTGEASAATWRRVLRQARSLVARGAIGVPDLTVYLVVAGGVRRRRASQDPLRHPPALRERHERVGRLEALCVGAALRGAAPGTLRSLRAGGSPTEVAKAVARWAAWSRPLPEPTAAAARALVALGKVKKPTFSPRAPR